MSGIPDDVIEADGWQPISDLLAWALARAESAADDDLIGRAAQAAAVKVAAANVSDARRWGFEGAVPNDVICEVAQRYHEGDRGQRFDPAAASASEIEEWAIHLDAVASALTVPAVAAVFARDAAVRQAWAAWNVNWRSDSDALLADAIADLYEAES